jgi:hypothetical protein
MTTIIKAAFDYLNEGYAVIPVSRETKKPLVKWKIYQRKSPTLLEWMRWFERWPNCNLALITGYFHNRVVLDFDDGESYLDWANGPTGIKHKSLTMTIRTGRGYHVHFTTIQKPGRGFVAYHPFGTKVEIKARGNYVLVPPSIHANGQPYENFGLLTTPIVVENVESVLGLFERPKVVKTKMGTTKHAGAKQDVPTTKVKAIKATFRIENFLQNSKDGPDSRGRIAANCPLPHHKDEHKSFWYHPEQQVCACAVCTQGAGENGSGGTWDVINLYAAIHNISNRAAIDELYQLTPQGMKRK